MSKTHPKPMKLNDKHKAFLRYYYTDGKTLAQSHALAFGGDPMDPNASNKGFAVKKFLESFPDFREIIRQFSPLPTLGAHMADIAFSAKDPNLRHKGQKLVAQCLGLLEADEGQAGGGFSLNIITGRAAIQVTAGDQAPGDPDPGKPRLVKKDGKPVSFIK